MLWKYNLRQARTVAASRWFAGGDGEIGGEIDGESKVVIFCECIKIIRVPTFVGTLIEDGGGCFISVS